METGKPTLTQLPAILGGTPARPAGSPEWPLEEPGVAEALRRCLADRSWGKYDGPNCRRLSEQLAGYHSSEHVVLCASGTAAVELALRGLKIGDGDEVLLAAYDFKGNFQDVLTVGAKPVLVDVDRENWNLDVAQLEAALSPVTKAVLVSHLHGGLVSMRRVIQFARDHQLTVIEDACQVPGAMIEGKRAGTWGDVGVWSFGGSKLLSAGRGGALFTNSAEIVQRVRLYSHRGNVAYPLSELQAAVLVPQLELLDERNRRRAENVERLRELLSERRGLAAFATGFIEAGSVGDSMAGYYKLGFEYDADAFDGLPREMFAQAMRAEGIALDPGFRSLHRIHSRRRFRQVGDLPIATAADERILTLHHPVLLEGEAALEEIVAALDKVRASARMILEAVSGQRSAVSESVES